MIGVISDTHGLLRPEALDVLDGSELILHLGDIGSPDVIPRLREIAPVVAVRGNVDKGEWAEEFPLTDVVSIHGKTLYLIHNIQDLDVKPEGLFDGIVFGHSHKPVNERRSDVLYFNPGSAGPRRFTLPIALGRLQVAESGIVGEIVELELRGAAEMTREN